MKVSSLLVRLMAAFGFIILLTVAVIYVVVNRTTASEFSAYAFRGQMSQVDQIVADLAAYYSARGNWQGVDYYFVQSLDAGGMMGGGRGRGMPAMMNAPMQVVDTNGVVIASRDGVGQGQKVTATQLSTGAPIQVNGQTVGTLINAAPAVVALDAQQQEFLQRTNLSLVLAGIAAGVIALVFGFLLFYQITAPLHALTKTSRAIAAGDLSARVANPSNNEIGQVGRAFNAMADSLAQSESARRNMIADIAHELRNPLGVIQGQLEGMIDGVFPLTSEQIASIHDETLLLARLVDDLRELALADAGQLKIARELTDLRALIVSTVDAFAPQATEKNVTLTAKIADDVPPVNIDAHRIKQVLRNLIANALRYTTEGSVTVQAVHNGATVQVRVFDTGQGIASEDLPHVFERFYRGDKSRARTRGGAGLGLTIAQQLVAAHGGTIQVASQPGKGTTFWFTLPI